MGRRLPAAPIPVSPIASGAVEIIDISQPLRAGMPVWPGDQPFTPIWSARIADGSSVNVGSLTLSLHTGTHADAPLHVRDGATSIDRLPLAAFVGPAVVVDAPAGGALAPELLDGIDVAATPRILFRTRRQPGPDAWEDDFAHLSPALATRLAADGAVLVGLDTPSVDPSDSKSLEAHHALFAGRVANLENLRLDHVSPGRYTLVALPLALEGMDASPVRAVLLRGGPAGDSGT
jgi:arylformamidase